MGFIKRAWLSVSRRKGKSVLLLAIIFILSNAIAGAVSIRQAAANVEKQIKTRLGGAATIEADWKRFEEDTNNQAADQQKGIQNLSLDTIKQIGQSAYVDYFDFTIHFSFYSDKVEPWVTQRLENNPEELKMFSQYQNFSVHGTNLSGDNFQKMMQKDLKAAFSDAKGTAFTAEDIEKGLSKAIISKELAEKNNLHVGDKMVMGNWVYDHMSNPDMSNTEKPEPYAKQEVILEIIGILEEKKEEKTSSKKQEQSIDDFLVSEKKNTIYVPNGMLEKEIKFSTEKNLELLKKHDPETAEAMEADSEELYYSNRYMLKNPEDVVAFKEETQPLLPEYYVVNAATDSYDSIAGPIRSVSKMATYVLVASIGATILIITLVVLLFLRDRKHELGIYMSLGEKKGKVIGQILIEVMLVAVIAVSVSVFSGNMLAGGLSKSMIQRQVESTHADQNGGVYFESYNSLNPQIEQEEVIEQYQVKLTPGGVALIYGISLGTVLVATVAPMIYIVRLKPRKILM